MEHSAAVAPPTGVTAQVTTTDWLKIAALLLVVVDHAGFYFDIDALRLPGRLAAPVFFFLIGFSRTRTVPRSWLVLGLFLTALDVWSDEEEWFDATLSILFNFALIRLFLGVLERIMQRGGLALVLLFAVLALAAPFGANIIEYGAEGWLWALLGVSCRLDGEVVSRTGRSLRSLAIAAGTVLVYGVVEALDRELTSLETLTLLGLSAGLAMILLRFRREPSRFAPPPPADAALRFIGRRTLELYAIQMMLFEVWYNV